MSRTPVRRIVIIGGGASGALMAAHLLRGEPQGIEVTIVETRAELGRGLAYSTGNPSHLLNVRAANMSAFADDPGHFARWLSARTDGPDIAGDPEFRFVSRGVYGRYLESLITRRLGDPARPRLLRVARDEARGLTVRPDGVAVALADGPPIRADIAILACGHEDFVADSPLHVSPWTEPVGGGAPSDATVLILGTGLTMVDTALALDERGHHGPILALSRRGLVPHAHRRVEPYKIDPSAAPLRAELSAMLAWLRRLAREREAAGGDWRSVVDGLRPFTQAIWRAMPPLRRERFLRHARPWWDIHRHRMAPEIAARISAMIASGRHGGGGGGARYAAPARAARNRDPERRARHFLQGRAERSRAERQSAGRVAVRDGPRACRPASDRNRGRAGLRGDRPRGTAVRASLRDRPDEPGGVLGDRRGAGHPPASRRLGGSSRGGRRAGAFVDGSGCRWRSAARPPFEGGRILKPRHPCSCRSPPP
jgi:hypothetical protein